MTTEPFGCSQCGVPKSEHGRRYHREAGVHQWQQPTQAQILRRMQDRRTARSTR